MAKENEVNFFDAKTREVRTKKKHTKEKTIVYLTDNALDERLAERCRELLYKAAQGRPIISVSQKPINFGENICVGEIGRSWCSIFKQQVIGLQAVKTPFVAFAEHDCLYTSEHFDYEPAELDKFYYNTNCWLGQWSDKSHPELKGMYSFWPGRCGESQLIGGTEIVLQAYQERGELIKKGYLSRLLPAEPGHKKDESLRQLEKAYYYASSGEPKKILRYLIDWAKKWTAVYFATKLPNVDLRHDNNFTGAKRGTKRRYELPYWGRLENVME